MRFNATSAPPNLIHKPLGGSQLAASTSLRDGTIYSATALGSFSGTNKVISNNNQIIDFRPGKTLWLVLQIIGTANGTETVVGCYNSSAFTGYVLTLETGTNSLSITSNTSSAAIVPAAAMSKGVHVICVVWKADTTLSYAIDGSPLIAVGTLAAPSATVSTCQSFIGGATANLIGVNYKSLVAGRVLAHAMWSTEASEAQARNNTYTTGNRFVLSSAVTSPAVVDFNAQRDWNGSASSITTLGSSPVVYQVSGTPTLTKVDELRIPLTNKYYFDSKIAQPTTDSNGNMFTMRDSYANVRLTTDSEAIAFEAINNLTDSLEAYLGAYKISGGTTYLGQFLLGTATLTKNTNPQTFSANPGSGTNKTIVINEGGALLTGTVGVFPYTRNNTVLRAVRLPVYLFDGSTSSNSRMLKPTPVQKRLVLMGDSILTGFWATDMASQSQTILLRQDYPTSGTGGVTAPCAGSNSVGNIASTADILAATLAYLLPEFDGTVSNTLWMELGTNDYANLGSPISLANFTTYYGNFLDAIHAARPDVQIICQSPIQRIAPASESANTFGSTLGDYRTAIQTLATARPSFCTYVNGAAGAIVSNANMYPDGIHITTAGAAQYKAFIKTTLGY